MPDVFVSHAHQNRDWVRSFVGPLQQAGGFDVWWDHKILPGEQYDDVIQTAMDKTRCVIVLWSTESIASRWVKTEAREAARRNILLPVSIQAVLPPLEFRSFETADLSDWRGELDHSHFVEVVQSVKLMIGKGGQAESAADVVPPPPSVVSAPLWKPDVRRPRFPLVLRGLAGAAAVVTLAVVAASYFGETPSSPPLTATEVPGKQTAPPTTPPVVPALPNLTYGVWTLHDAVDDDKNNWNNSVIKFASQVETADGLALQGTFSWRSDDILVGTEDFTGHYVRATRQLILEGTRVTQIVSRGRIDLDRGSYSAVLSDDGRHLQNGRWGQSTSSRTVVLSRWAASR